MYFVVLAVAIFFSIDFYVLLYISEFFCLYAQGCWSDSIQSFLCSHRSGLESLAQWDSPMQVKLSRWKSGLNTLLVELLPWALLTNNSQWDLWLFEGEKIILQIPAGKVVVPPNFKVRCHVLYPVGGLFKSHLNQSC